MVYTPGFWHSQYIALHDSVKKLIDVKNLADNDEPLASNPLQALDSFSELVSYRNLLENIKLRFYK